MPAYMIIHVSIKDREKFINDYAKPAAALVAQFGGRYVVRAPGAEVLEGDLPPGGSVVVSEWPDKAAVLKFWNSTEYTEVKKFREGIADARVLLVETTPA